MLIVPAIDIMSGRVVRLEQGDFKRPINYEHTPFAYAQMWVSQGARFLHVVDLDGARTGEIKNFSCICDIAKIKDVRIEVGGGIRNIGSIRKYLDSGIDRVVLSTRVLEDASFLLSHDIQKYLSRVCVSMDIRDIGDAGATTGTAGWTQKSDMMIDLESFITTLFEAGISCINFSDIKKDGMLSGPDVEKIKMFLAQANRAAGKKIFFTYAGGVSSLEDVRCLKDLEKEGLSAIIVGRAIYEKKFTVSEAIKAAL